MSPYSPPLDPPLRMGSLFFYMYNYTTIYAAKQRTPVADPGNRKGGFQTIECEALIEIYYMGIHAHSLAHV